jgi:hypothetical protein
MREIYYAVFKNVDYKTLIMASVAEAIKSQKATFINDKLMLKEKADLNSYEKQILARIKLNSLSKFHYSDYHKWAISLINECFEKKYLTRFLFIWTKPTNYFRKIIEENLQTFNQNIIKYIDTKNLEHLKRINEHFNHIQLPQHHTPNEFEDTDMKMLCEVLSKGYEVGLFNTNK